MCKYLKGEELDDKITEAVREAHESFWEVICEKFPEIKGGDVSFEYAIPLEIKAEEAVKHWYEGNQQSD